MCNGVKDLWPLFLLSIPLAHVQFYLRVTQTMMMKPAARYESRDESLMTSHQQYHKWLCPSQRVCNWFRTAPLSFHCKSRKMSSSEHNENEAVPSEEDQKDQQSPRCPSTRECPLKGKQVVGIIFCVAGCALLWTTFSRPDASTEFLKWVQANPYLGIGAFLIVFAVCVVFMIPVGTPLTLGCGYIYKGVYGWVLGVGVATAVSMAGSALGAVTCFLLGRYMMRDQVRKWVRKYPLFDAIDIGKLNARSSFPLMQHTQVGLIFG